MDERASRGRGAPRDSAATVGARATREHADRQVRATSKTRCKGLQEPLESRDNRDSMVYLERRVMPEYLEETGTLDQREREEMPDTQDNPAQEVFRVRAERRGRWVRQASAGSPVPKETRASQV